MFGFEGQGNWADFSGDNISAISGLRDRSKINAFGLITGQVGYAWNNVLVYVKGGGAVVSDRYRSFDVASGLEFDRANETRWGGTVGAGVEFGFAPNWTVGFEYDHIFLGNRTIGFTGSGNFAPLGVATRSDRISQDVDIGLVRVNYRWGGPMIARYRHPSEIAWRSKAGLAPAFFVGNGNYRSVTVTFCDYCGFSETQLAALLV